MSIWSTVLGLFTYVGGSIRSAHVVAIFVACGVIITSLGSVRIAAIFVYIPVKAINPVTCVCLLVML
jgi:hypothetical protein